MNQVTQDILFGAAILIPFLVLVLIAVDDGRGPAQTLRSSPGLVRLSTSGAHGLPRF